MLVKERSMRVCVVEWFGMLENADHRAKCLVGVRMLGGWWMTSLSLGGRTEV